MRPTTADAVHETSAICIRCENVGGAVAFLRRPGCSEQAREDSRAVPLAVSWERLDQRLNSLLKNQEGRSFAAESAGEITGLQRHS